MKMRAAWMRKTWDEVLGGRKGQDDLPPDSPAPSRRPANSIDLDFNPDDPLATVLRSASGALEIGGLELESAALRRLKEAGVKVVVPLISQGELVGTLNLGPRRSEQEYSTDDYRMLNTLAAQAAPALRVAQMAQEQQMQARERERMSQELRVARLIQETLLPKDLPDLPGWRFQAYWQPARAVSGDFYDFLPLPDGRLGFLSGDVTDKGVPAALVMATTRSVLRTAAGRAASPADVLETANTLLCPDIPSEMFVTCLYGILDPASGRIVYANAGHNPPYLHTPDGALQLPATGLPLGLMPDIRYEQKEVVLRPGEYLLIYSDGLVEAHNPDGELFGFPRTQAAIEQYPHSEGIFQYLLGILTKFTGRSWEQEDDVTFVSLERIGEPDVNPEPNSSVSKSNEKPSAVAWRTLLAFDLPSAPGNERTAMEQVAAVAAQAGLPAGRLERLKTAVGEATMNAMEHGNHYRDDLPVHLSVLQKGGDLAVRVKDYGGDKPIPEHVAPNLEAKLTGEQSPRGWGLFLIQSMVDELRVEVDPTHHTVELLFHMNPSGEPGRTE